MYTVTVRNHMGKEKEWNFVEYLFAEQVYETAKKCLDCAYALITDAISGEVIADWGYLTGESNYECREDEWNWE